MLYINKRCLTQQKKKEKKQFYVKRTQIKDKQDKKVTGAIQEETEKLILERKVI